MDSYQTQRGIGILPESIRPPLKANTATPIAGKPTTPTRTSQRKAKLDAEEKISLLRQYDEALWTQETIVEADEQEEPEAGIVDHMGGRLRDMSITPTRSVVRSLSKEADGENEDEEAIVDVSDAEDASTRKNAGKRHDQDWASWQKPLNSARISRQKRKRTRIWILVSTSSSTESLSIAMSWRNPQS
jgi:hypothetical protein